MKTGLAALLIGCPIGAIAALLWWKLTLAVVLVAGGLWVAEKLTRARGAGGA